MRHKLLGPSGLRVSELCLGTLTFGEPKRWGAEADAARAILAAFAEAGGSFIDTAPNYGGGAAEEIVGAFVRDRRDEFVLATKYTASADPHPLAGGNSRRTMVRSVEQSLRRLGTDRVDLLWLHYWDATTPIEEILRALDDLVRAGKVLYAGLSDTPAWLASRAATMANLRGWSQPIAIQLEYNLVARTAERELMPMAEALDLGVVCWGPLGAGALAGGSDPQRRSRTALPDSLAHAAAALQSLSEDTGIDPARLALGWLLQRSGRLIPLVGARTAGQLEAILAASTLTLDEPTMVQLDRIAPPALGFPHDLIHSCYLRRLALGDPERIAAPLRPRC